MKGEELSENSTPPEGVQNSFGKVQSRSRGSNGARCLGINSLIPLPVAGLRFSFDIRWKRGVSKGLDHLRKGSDRRPGEFNDAFFPVDELGMECARFILF